MASIPPAFLEGSPSNATLHQIDFEHTTPPIPAYKDHFAAVIDNFLSPTECAQLLSLAEQSTGKDDASVPLWDRAMINVGNNQQIMATELRNCGRIMWDTHDIAERLLARLRPFLERCGIDTVENRPLVTGHGLAMRGEVYRVSSLNERLRFLKYEGGEYFRPHFDGTYMTPDERERSLFTVHLYLNGDGVQDLKELKTKIKGAEAEAEDWLFANYDNQKRNASLGESGSESEADADADQDNVQSDRPGNEADRLLGGATSFTDGYDADDAVRFFPKTGSVLIFQQRNLIHGGDDVFRGVKYTMRVDVMYEKVQ